MSEFSEDDDEFLSTPLRQYYARRQLGVEQLKRIVESSTNTAGQRFSTRLVQWGMAASLLLLVAGGVHSVSSTNERTQVTLQEAAMNHSASFNLEFESDDVLVLNRDMDQLPFSVAVPEQYSSGFTIVGARYCSIRGNLAAHLKLIDHSTDKQVSLFMTPVVEGLNKIHSERKEINGTDIQLWRERGMFYALAESTVL